MVLLGKTSEDDARGPYPWNECWQSRVETLNFQVQLPGYDLPQWATLLLGACTRGDTTLCYCCSNVVQFADYLQ